MTANAKCSECRGCSACPALDSVKSPIAGGLPLSVAKNGSRGIITRISGKEEVRRHLACLGFTIGEPISVFSELNGNMIVGIRGSRVAIDRSMTSKIMINPEM